MKYMGYDKHYTPKNLEI